MDLYDIDFIFQWVPLQKTAVRDDAMNKCQSAVITKSEMKGKTVEISGGQQTGWFLSKF